MFMFARSLLLSIFVGLNTVVCSALVLLLRPFPYPVRLAIAKAWCRGNMIAGRWLCGLRYRIEGREHIPDQPCVIMIKHASLFEAYAQVAIFERTVWVIKRELLRVPVFGWGVRGLKPIAIDRSSGGTAVKQVIEQGKERLAEGISVTVFPEGTRMPPGTTRRYGVSGAALAEASGCPILPVAHNAADLWPRSGFPKRPGLIRFCIGPPIDAAGRPPRETNLIVQEWIEGKMAEISEGYRDAAPAEH